MNTRTATIDQPAFSFVGTPANDNKWDGRLLLAWPTAARLARAKRHADLALLISYKRLADVAFGEPANDNYLDAGPAPEEDDDRGAAQIIDEVDRILNESGIKPTIAEMKVAATLTQGPSNRPVVTTRDNKTGAVMRELGGLRFINGAELLEYRTTTHGNAQKPRLVQTYHRNKKKPAASLVPNSSGVWALEEKISAQQELALIFNAIPASSARILEIACGPTTAREIGEAFGKREKTAERLGVEIIDRAIKHLREVWSPLNAVCA